MGLFQFPKPAVPDGNACRSDGPDVCVGQGHRPVSRPTQLWWTQPGFPKLEEGELKFHGESWSLTGRAEAPSIRDAAINLVPGRDNWTVEIAAPDVPLPRVTPYLWASEQTKDGDFAFRLCTERTVAHGAGQPAIAGSK